MFRLIVLSYCLLFAMPAFAQQEQGQNGVVKGPKTMPAVRKSTVESEVLFAPNEDTKGNILQRLNDKKTNPTPQNNSPVEIQALTSGEKTLKINFKKEMEDIDKVQKNEINNKIIPTLLNNPASRLQIESFTTPNPTSENPNTGKMVALSRAIMVRSHILAHDIPAHKIDIRAICSQKEKQPEDHVNLIVNVP